MRISEIQNKIEHEYLKALIRDYKDPLNVDWRDRMRDLARDGGASAVAEYIWRNPSEYEYHETIYDNAVEYIVHLYNDELLGIMKKRLNMNDEEFDEHIKGLLTRYDKDEIAFRFVIGDTASAFYRWFDDAVREFADEVYYGI